MNNPTHILYLKSSEEFNTLNTCIKNNLLPDYKDCHCTKGSDHGDFMIEVDDAFLKAVGEATSNFRFHQVEYEYMKSTSEFLMKDCFDSKPTVIYPNEMLCIFFDQYKTNINGIKKLHEELNKKQILPANVVELEEKKETVVCIDTHPILISFTHRERQILDTIEKNCMEISSIGSSIPIGTYKLVASSEVVQIYAYDTTEIYKLIGLLRFARKKYVPKNTNSYHWNQNSPWIMYQICHGPMVIIPIQTFVTDSLNMMDEYVSEKVD